MEHVNYILTWIMISFLFKIGELKDCSFVCILGASTPYAKHYQGIYNRTEPKCYGRFVYTKRDPTTYAKYHLQLVEKKYKRKFQGWVVSNTSCVRNAYNLFKSQDGSDYPYSSLASWEEFDGQDWVSNKNLRVFCSDDYECVAAASDDYEDEEKDEERFSPDPDMIALNPTTASVPITDEGSSYYAGNTQDELNAFLATVDTSSGRSENVGSKKMAESNNNSFIQKVLNQLPLILCLVIILILVIIVAVMCAKHQAKNVLQLKQHEQNEIPMRTLTPSAARDAEYLNTEAVSSRSRVQHCPDQPLPSPRPSETYCYVDLQ